MISIASQVTSSVATRAHITMFNDAIRRAQAFPDVGLTFHPLHEASVSSVVFADASLSNNSDFLTQLVYRIFL